MDQTPLLKPVAAAYRKLVMRLISSRVLTVMEYKLVIRLYSKSWPDVNRRGGAPKSTFNTRVYQGNDALSSESIVNMEVIRSGRKVVERARGKTERIVDSVGRQKWECMEAGGDYSLSRRPDGKAHAVAHGDNERTLRLEPACKRRTLLGFETRLPTPFRR